MKRLISKIKKWIKQKYCEHDYHGIGDEKCIGMTASWALEPTKEFEQTYRCTKCGKEEKRQYIYYGGIKD